MCCAALDYFWNMFPGISGYPGNIGNIIFLYFWIFQKKTRAEISRRMHRWMSRDLPYETDSGPKTKTVSDPNFQVTPTTTTTTTTTRRQLSHLARALNHHAQGPNIPFGVIPHFDYICYVFSKTEHALSRPVLHRQRDALQAVRIQSKTNLDAGERLVSYICIDRCH